MKFANLDIKTTDHSEEWKVNCIKGLVQFLTNLSHNYSKEHLRVTSSQ